MRITTGEHKGRRLNLPKGIRPTQNKVRKALFDILGDIEGLSFLELFAGSGGVGFEALSRRAREIVLVESNPDCISAIKKNIETLKTRACNLCMKDSQAAIEGFFRAQKKFNIIFLDPPYYKPKVPRPGTKIPGYSGSTAAMNSGPLSKKTLQTLDAYDILAPDGLIVAQHFKKEGLPVELGFLSLFRQTRYGDTLLSFYRKKET